MGVVGSSWFGIRLAIDRRSVASQLQERERRSQKHFYVLLLLQRNPYHLFLLVPPSRDRMIPAGSGEWKRGLAMQQGMKDELAARLWDLANRF